MRQQARIQGAVEMGKILRYGHGPESVKGVDPRLWDIVQHAVAAQPYDAIIRSGAEHRTNDKGNHGKGFAVDVTLVDKNGNKIPDKGPEAFSSYEPYAQAARVYQTKAYPELDKQLRWGAGFSDTTMDLMHLDITPPRDGKTAYYDWDSGLTKAGKAAFPKVVSNGGLGGTEGARRVAQISQSLSGGPIPPAGMSSDAPAPRVRPASLSVAPRAAALSAAPSGATFGNTGVKADRSQLKMTPGQQYEDMNNPRGVVADSRLASLLAPKSNALAIGAARPTVVASNTAKKPPIMQGGPAVSVADTRAEQQRNRPAVATAAAPIPIRPAKIIRVSEINPDGSDKVSGIDTLRRPTSPILADPIGRGPNLAQLQGDAGVSPTPMPGRPAALSAGSSQPNGMIAAGNIDLNNRPVFFGNDGNYGTEHSISIGTDRGEVLIPTIVNGRQVSNDAAIQHYRQTGENMGTFASAEAADAYAQQVHNRDQGLGRMPVPMPGRPAALSLTNSPAALSTVPRVAMAAPQPRSRPVAASAATAAPSQPAAQPAASAASLRLPSGKMVAPGTYSDAKSGISYSISAGANGEAVITPNRAGAVNIGREMNAPTIVGSMIRSKISDVVPDAFANAGTTLGTAANNTKNAAIGAIDTVVKGAPGAIGNAFNGVAGLFGGGQTAKPTSWWDRTVAPAAAPAPRVVAAPKPSVAKPTPAPQPAQRQQQQQPQQTFAGSSTGRNYTVGQTYHNNNGSFVAQPGGKFQKVA